MATRYTTITFGRHLARLYHHEYSGLLHSSFSVVKKRGFSKSRFLASSSSQSPHHGSSSAATAAAPLDIESLRAEMLARPEQLTYDTLSPTPSHLLDISLAEYINDSGGSSSSNTNGSQTTLQQKDPPSSSSSFPLSALLKPGYHLIHFPLALPPSGLCPDGTDPYHSPGGPFERRMWAGGSIDFFHHPPLKLSGAPAVCVERICDVSVRGPPGEEKVFVDVLRRYGEAEVVTAPADAAGAAASSSGPPRRLGMMKGPKEAIREVRTLVFMRKQESTKSSSSHSSEDTGRLVKVPWKPTYKKTLIPDRTLLFHFSALSYNAHLVHLDTRYSQDVEGRPGLLVHGPLCLNLMLAALREGQETKREMVRRIDYRNLAPLYSGEEMTVCVRRSAQRGGGSKCDVWIENQHGGLCVKGTVIMEESPADAKE